MFFWSFIVTSYFNTESTPLFFTYDGNIRTVFFSVFFLLCCDQVLNLERVKERKSWELNTVLTEAVLNVDSPEKALPSLQRPPSIALCSLTFFSKRSCRFETLSSKLHTFRTEHCCWLFELPSVQPYTFNSNRVHTIKEAKCSMFCEIIFVSNIVA